MSSEKKNFELDRRSLLKNILVGTGLGTSGLMNTFLTNMMINFMQKGTAQAAEADPAFEDFKFISFVMAGGLPRHYWDLPLKPLGTEKMVFNPMVVTNFRPDGTSFYSTTKVGNYNFPNIWNCNIPIVGGGSVSMKSIASNMLTMRGVDMQIDDHFLDRYRQMTPVDGGLSLSGMVADAASTPMPAVGINGGNKYYNSAKGISYLNLNGNDPLKKAMTPFAPIPNMLSHDNGSIEAAIDQAMLKLAASAQNKGKYIPTTFASRFNARKMMVKQFGDLSAQYKTLVSKYRGLISRSFAPSADLKLAGVDDMNISGNSGIKQGIHVGFFSGNDLLSLTNSNTGIEQLAEGMAIAEFMIINGLSSSVNIETANITNVYIQQLSDNGQVVSGNYSMTVDADVHDIGGDIDLVIFTGYYRALSACINELIKKLKEKKLGAGNLFDKTVIAITSEFNRNPRMDGSGCDHGFEGSNYTVFSGMVEELSVAGNIKVNDGNRLGTWGVAAGMPELGGRVAIIGNAASTVANMLELKSPTPNDASYTFKENGKAKLKIKSLQSIG